MKIIRALAYTILIAIALYVALSLIGRKDYRVGGAEMRAKYERLLTYNILNDDWKKLNCTVELNSSLAQGLHIVKEGKNAFCAEEIRGEPYDKLGNAFSCSADDAAKVDGAVRSSGNCTFALGNSVPEDVLNYYAFVLTCVANLTNWTYVEGGPCPSESPQSVVYAVVDDKGNVFY